MKRITALFLCLAFIVCTGCGSKKNTGRTDPAGSTKSVSEDNNYGASLSGEGGGRIFKRSSVSLPELGLYAQMAVAINNDEIVIVCLNGAKEKRFFSMDISTLSVRPLEINFSGEIVDIDSMGDGVLTILSINEDGVYVISTVNPDLSIREISLAEMPEYYSYDDICSFENGYLLNQSGTVVATDKDGAPISSFGPYRGGITFAHSSEGEPLIISQAQDEIGAKIQVLDSTFKLKETYDLKNSYYNFSDGRENGLFATSSHVICNIDYKNDTRSGYCNELVSGGGAINFIYISEDCFFSIQKGVPSIWTPSSADGITVLTLATYGINTELSAAVNGFNELNDKYKIDLVNYSAYDEAGDTNLGLLLLSTDIISGDTPDIYSLDMLPARMFAARGLFQDLRPFLESDPSISYDDLIPSIAKAMENEGKMYYLVPSFYLETMYGNRELAGDKTDWSINNLLSLSKEYSAQELLGDDMTKNAFLRDLLTFNSEQYIDYERGTCNFLDPGFIQLLDFAAGLPDEPLMSGSDRWGKAYCGEQMLIMEEFQDLIPSISTADGVFQGNTSYIGFPTDNGTGVKISPVMWLAMSSTAVSQEGVWEFFSYLLSDEFQNRTFNREGETKAGPLLMNGMSSVKKNFEQQLDHWIETMNRNQLSKAAFLDGSLVYIPSAPTDDKTRSTAVSLTDRVSGIYELDSNVYTIVIEEAAAFFNGDKTAEEAAKLIQSRASIYLAEQYS